ncbi:RDD family protein [Aurantivibrio plasticivorans]
MKISTQISVETPESIDLYAEPAGIVIRCLAWLLDQFVIAGVQLVCFILLSLTGAAGWGILLIIWFSFSWFYSVLFEVLSEGQTPGKKWMGIAVVNDDLTSIGWGTSIVRNFIRFADAMPIAYFAGIITMANTKHFQRLGDLAAGSLVIYRQTENSLGGLPDARPQVANFPMGREDQLAVIGFAQRHNQLSAERQQELANIMGPLLPVDEQHRVDYLRGIGRGLVG